MSAQSPLRDGDTADFELIETMRWQPETGFLRFDRHLARLYGSAAELSFDCDPQKVGAVLGDAVDGARTATGLDALDHVLGGWHSRVP